MHAWGRDQPYHATSQPMYFCIHGYVHAGLSSRAFDATTAMPVHALLRDVSISDAAADVLTNQGLPRNAALLLATVDSAVQVDLEYLAKDMNGGKEIDAGSAGRVTTNLMAAFLFPTSLISHRPL